VPPHPDEDRDPADDLRQGQQRQLWPVGEPPRRHDHGDPRGGEQQRREEAEVVPSVVTALA
jgi:hypothetical protein